MDLGISKKTALITGGTRGIGATIALGFASEGVNIAIADINGDAYIDLEKQITNLGVKSKFYKVDVSSMDSVKETVANVKKDFDTIDILVNNAGVTRDNLLIRMKEEDWDFVLDVNLKGAFNCIKNVVPIMFKQRWGRIINISSVVGEMGNAGQINYSSSKAGLIGMTKSSAKEFASRNITVNAVAPGFIVSDMTNSLSDEVKENYYSSIPLKRFGETKEISDLVSFLASDKASYITGQVVGINGGMYT